MSHSAQAILYYSLNIKNLKILSFRNFTSNPVI